MCAHFYYSSTRHYKSTQYPASSSSSMSAQQLLVKKNKDDDKKNKDDDKKNNKEDDKEKKNDKDKKDKDAPSQPKQQPQPPNPPRPPQQPSGKQKERDEIRSGFCFESDAFKYTLDDRIGDGGYGRVFEAEVAPKKEATKCPMKVAIKIEPRIQLNTVNIEAGVLQTAKDQRCQHFPTIYDSGTIALKPKYFSFISMELLGRDLYQLRKERKDFKFSLGTALRVGLESLEALRELHDVCGYISRDVKPGNFVTGLNTSDFLRSVFMIDFGLCRRFRDANNNLLPSRGDVGWRGTNRYGSLRAHRHLDLARRDDTESWFYMLVELTKGALSWAVIREREEIYNRKMAARTDDDFFRGCPAEYKELLAHIDELQFADAPGYAILTGILEKIMQRTGIERRGPMDWENGDDDSQPTGDERTSDPDSILRLHSAQKKQT